MLADFGMMWKPEEGVIHVHDTYDFTPFERLFVGDRPKEMKIRSKIKFDPKKGSKLLRNNMEDFYSYPDPAVKYSNKFDDGGPKDTYLPTKQEYFDTKAQNIINNAHKRSLERTEPAVPIVPNEQTKEIWQANIDREIKEYEQDIQKYKPGSYLYRILTTKISDLKNAKYDPYCKGASCIYTATDNYSNDGINRRVSGNKTFISDIDKYGFREIPKTDLKQGDLVQELEGNSPTHAMIFDSYDNYNNSLYNYSRGGSDASSIVKKRKYPAENLKYYRFIGTPMDRLKWESEYIQEHIKPRVEAAEHVGIPNKDYSFPTYFNITVDSNIFDMGGVWNRKRYYRK